MLICTRNGDIIEINLTYRFEGMSIKEKDTTYEFEATNQIGGTFNNDKAPAKLDKGHTEGEIDQNSSENDDEKTQNLIDFDQNVIISYPVTQSLQQTAQQNNLESVSETDKTDSSIETESSSSEQDTSNIMNLKFRKVYFAVK